MSESGESTNANELSEFRAIDENLNTATHQYTARNATDVSREDIIRLAAKNIGEVSDQVSEQQKDTQILADQMKATQISQINTDKTANSVVGKLGRILNQSQSAEVSVEKQTGDAQQAVQNRQGQ